MRLEFVEANRKERRRGTRWPVYCIRREVTLFRERKIVGENMLERKTEMNKNGERAKDYERKKEKDSSLWGKVSDRLRIVINGIFLGMFNFDGN